MYKTTSKQQNSKPQATLESRGLPAQGAFIGETLSWLDLCFTDLGYWVNQTWVPDSVLGSKDICSNISHLMPDVDLEFEQ